MNAHSRPLSSTAPVPDRARPPLVSPPAGPGAPADVEFESRDAKGILPIDQDQTDPESVTGRRRDAVLPGPLRGIPRPLFIRNLPHCTHPLRVEVGWNRESPVRHHRPSFSRSNGPRPLWKHLDSHYTSRGQARQPERQGTIGTVRATGEGTGGGGPGRGGSTGDGPDAAGQTP